MSLSLASTALRAVGDTTWRSFFTGLGAPDSPVAGSFST
jgi:hypothetical protein